MATVDRTHSHPVLEKSGVSPGLAEAGRFRSTRLRGCWQGKGRPRAPQTEVAGGCVSWAPLPPKGFFLGSDCSLDKEEEGVEWSLDLLGINCLRAADCVLAERNFSTTELTASPNSPDCEWVRPVGTPSPLDGRRGRDFHEGTKEGERWEAKVSSTTGMAV